MPRCVKHMRAVAPPASLVLPHCSDVTVAVKYFAQLGFNELCLIPQKIEQKVSMHPWSLPSLTCRVFDLTLPASEHMHDHARIHQQ